MKPLRKNTGLLFLTQGFEDSLQASAGASQRFACHTIANKQGICGRVAKIILLNNATLYAHFQPSSRRQNSQNPRLHFGVNFRIILPGRIARGPGNLKWRKNGKSM
jgi:hypothetical protein